MYLFLTWLRLLRMLPLLRRLICLYDASTTPCCIYDAPTALLRLMRLLRLLAVRRLAEAATSQ